MGEHEALGIRGIGARKAGGMGPELESNRRSSIVEKPLPGTSEVEMCMLRHGFLEANATATHHVLGLANSKGNRAFGKQKHKRKLFIAPRAESTTQCSTSAVYCEGHGGFMIRGSWPCRPPAPSPALGFRWKKQNRRKKEQRTTSKRVLGFQSPASHAPPPQVSMQPPKLQTWAPCTYPTQPTRALVTPHYCQAAPTP